MTLPTVLSLDTDRPMAEDLRKKIAAKLDELLAIINTEAAPYGIEVNFSLGPSGYGKRMQITSLRIIKEL